MEVTLAIVSEVLDVVTVPNFDLVLQNRGAKVKTCTFINIH